MSAEEITPDMSAEQLAADIREEKWTVVGLWHESWERWAGHFDCLTPQLAEDLAHMEAQERGLHLAVVAVFAGYLMPADGDYATYVDANAWERTEPPEGEGWQLWQTISEGGPISPVFDTPEKLAFYATTNHWGSQRDTMLTGTYEQALAFIKGPGWAPSLIGSGGVVEPGELVLGREARDVEETILRDGREADE